MPLNGPTQLQSIYDAVLTADELAELELLYARLNEKLDIDYKPDEDVYEYMVESDVFSLYPERVTNQIIDDCLAAGWDEAEAEPYAIPTVTLARHQRGIRIKLTRYP